MAIIKQIELENGVTTNYHRIVSINKIINVADIIEVASYTSKEKRLEEQNGTKSGAATDVFIDTLYINKEYDEKEEIEDAYKYLKNTDKFKGATDDK